VKKNTFEKNMVKPEKPYSGGSKHFWNSVTLI